MIALRQEQVDIPATVTRGRTPTKVRHTVEVSEGTALGEKYILNYLTRGKSWEFHAKSDAAAILLARRKLGLVVTASLDKFKKSGGKNIIKKATGLQIYPHTTH